VHFISDGAVRLTLNWRALGFSAAAAISATLTFGLAPALRGSRIAPQDGLRQGGRGTAGARSHWFQHSLVVIETALAVALLTSGGLLLETLQHLRNTDLGIRSDKLLTFETPLLRYKDFGRRVAFVNAELEKVRAIPGVINAGAISRIPLTVTDQATFYLLAGQSGDVIPGQVALTRVVSRGYFQTIGAHLREGRFFEISDRRSDSPVAVVNETFADRNFRGRSPLGARLKFGELNEKGYWYTIIGVVKEIRDTGVAGELKPTIYRLHEQADQSGDLPSGIVVRTAVEPASIVSVVRQAIWSVDRNQSVWHVRTLEEIVDRQLSTAAQSSLKSFQRKDQDKGAPPDDPGNPTVNFHGEKRSNQANVSRTDADAKLARKGNGKEVKLSFQGNLLVENRNGLIVNTELFEANGTAERDAALIMLEQIPGAQRVTVAGDKGYDTKDFVAECRNMKVTPHVAQTTIGRAGARLMRERSGMPAIGSAKPSTSELKRALDG
jgi:hypothetical protein